MVWKLEKTYLSRSCKHVAFLIRAILYIILTTKNENNHPYCYSPNKILKGFYMALNRNPDGSE